MTAPPYSSETSVLVVEDDRKLAQLLCRGLEEAGFHAYAAFDASSALQHAAEAPPSAVLLDIGLPDMSGLVVCERLRAAGLTMPVVILSARDSVDDLEAARAAGATDYLVKPFSLHELASRLVELVGATRQHAA